MPGGKIRLTCQNIQTHEKTSRIRIYIDDPSEAKKSASKLKSREGFQDDGIYERLKQLKRALPSIQVKGLPQSTRGVINKNEKAGDKLELLVTGYGLAEVMGTEGQL